MAKNTRETVHMGQATTPRKRTTAPKAFDTSDAEPAPDVSVTVTHLEIKSDDPDAVVRDIVAKYNEQAAKDLFDSQGDPGVLVGLDVPATDERK